MSDDKKKQMRKEAIIDISTGVVLGVIIAIFINIRMNIGV